MPHRIFNPQALKALGMTVLAAVLGYISARFLPQGNPLVTIPWGIAAVALGYAASRRTTALAAGSLVGFVASYAYLLSDTTGHIGAKIILVIALPATFGLLCGGLAAWIGWRIRPRKIARH